MGRKRVPKDPTGIIPNMVMVRLAQQTRLMSWSELCFMFIGSKNVGVITRIIEELAEHGVSHLITESGIGYGVEEVSWKGRHLLKPHAIPED